MILEPVKLATNISHNTPKKTISGNVKAVSTRRVVTVGKGEGSFYELACWEFMNVLNKVS